MPTTHEIRLRSNAYVANLNARIAVVIEDVSQSIVNMNKAQMLSSKDSKGNPLVHKLTGSENLSLGYQKLTGKVKPNLFRFGDFQPAMFLQVNENNNTFFIDSEDQKAGILTDNYGNDSFGVPEKDQPRARSITSKAVAKDYIGKVWGR